ncbi:unnamed protein product [Closterium sp. NIES-54]
MLRCASHPCAQGCRQCFSRAVGRTARPLLRAYNRTPERRGDLLPSLPSRHFPCCTPLAALLSCDRCLRIPCCWTCCCSALQASPLFLYSTALRTATDEQPASLLVRVPRASRYALLHGQCVERRLGVLMTAHHGNDQTEVLLLRLIRCSGMDGLACMPLLSPLPPSPPPLLPCFAPLHAQGNTSMRPSTTGSTRSNGRSTATRLKCLDASTSDGSSEGVVVVRPLLGVWKQQLVQFCESHAQPWIEDPSNASSLFLRNRIRHALAALATHDASALHAAAHSTTAVAAALRSHRLTAARHLAAATLLPTSGGAVHISVVDLLAPHWSDHTRLHVLSLLLQHVAQRPYPPRTRGVRALLDRMHLYLTQAASRGAYSMAGCTLTALPGSQGTVACIAAHAGEPAR